MKQDDLGYKLIIVKAKWPIHGGSLQLSNFSMFSIIKVFFKKVIDCNIKTSFPQHYNFPCGRRHAVVQLLGVFEESSKQRF